MTRHRSEGRKKTPVVADRGSGFAGAGAAADAYGLRPASITAHIEVIWKSVLVE